MSDPSLPGTPGTGPIPEPEAEGFREEQTEAEKQRLVDQQKDALERSKEAKDFYTGAPEEVEPPPPEGETGTGTRSSKDTGHTTSHSTSHKPGPKGSSSKS
jgi:hypothetical protein